MYRVEFLKEEGVADRVESLFISRKTPQIDVEESRVERME